MEKNPLSQENTQSLSENPFDHINPNDVYAELKTDEIRKNDLTNELADSSIAPERRQEILHELEDLKEKMLLMQQSLITNGAAEEVTKQATNIQEGDPYVLPTELPTNMIPEEDGDGDGDGDGNNRKVA